MKQVDKDGLMQSFEIAHLLQENRQIKTLLFQGRLESALPGQFVMAWLPGVGEKPFSVASAVPFALTIADVGPVSHAISQLRPGEKLWFRGPLGRGFELRGSKHLLVGGGYGAAPLAFLAKHVFKQGGQVSVCLGAKGEEELLLETRLKKMGCFLRVATEDGSKGRRGLVTTIVEERIEEDRPDCIYASGPTGMLLAVAALARRYQIPVQLSFEALMRCGVGLCGSCELSEDLCRELGLPTGWLACQDGPVAFVG